MGPGEFLNINFFTALFTLINTLILLFVLTKFLWKPVMKMIDDRQKEIDGMYDAAEAAQQQAAALRASYEEQLSQAAATSERLVKEAVARGQSRQEEILRMANDQADAIRQKASLDIAREKKKAVNDAKNEIAELAVAIAGKVVEKNLDTAAQSALVDQFIDRLGDADE